MRLRQGIFNVNECAEGRLVKLEFDKAEKNDKATYNEALRNKSASKWNKLVRG